MLIATVTVGPLGASGLWEGMGSPWVDDAGEQASPAGELHCLCLDCGLIAVQGAEAFLLGPVYVLALGCSVAAKDEVDEDPTRSRVDLA